MCNTGSNEIFSENPFLGAFCQVKNLNAIQKEKQIHARHVSIDKRTERHYETNFNVPGKQTGPFRKHP